METGTNPCSLLNTSSLDTLWFPPNTAYETAFNRIFNNGNLITYSVALAALQSKAVYILGNRQPNSDFRIIKFLSDSGTTSGDAANNYSKLEAVLLEKKIVDHYIVSASGLGKAVYTYGTENSTPAKLTDDNIKTIREKLVTDGQILSEQELFDSSQFGPTATSAANRECLVYLYATQQNVNKSLTPEQTTRLSMLEVRNLKFFSNFFMEYCFYSTRYSILLSEYFTLYTQPSTAQMPNKNIFGSGVPARTGTAAYTQSEYLSALAFHMACLNTRMTDMRRLLSEITKYYQGVFTKIQSTINTDANTPGGNKELTNTILALNDSAKDIQAYMSESDFKKQVMEYNSQKNRYANVLLSLYAFLNIAAIAAVFQLSRG